MLFNSSLASQLVCSAQTSHPFPKIRLGFLGSWYKGFSFIQEIRRGPLRKCVSIVGVATDNPDDPICRPDRRCWSEGYSEADKLMVSRLAERYGIPVYRGDVTDSNFIETVQEEWRPDLIISSVYGQKIPQQIISYPQLAAWNLHPSGTKWPSFKGGRPYEKMLAKGVDRFYITLHELDDEFDHGLFVARSKPIFIPPGVTVKDLHKLSAVPSATFAAEQIAILLQSRLPLGGGKEVRPLS